MFDLPARLRADVLLLTLLSHYVIERRQKALGIGK